MNKVLEFRVAAEMEQLKRLRKNLRQALQRMGVAELHLDRLLLVVDEVLSNAIEHGKSYRQGVKPIMVRVSQQKAGLLLSIEDADVPADVVAQIACDIDQNCQQVPAAPQERGRGLFLVQRFLVDLQVGPAEGGGMHLQGLLQGAQD